jgi:acetyl esterase/lipase
MKKITLSFLMLCATASALLAQTPVRFKNEVFTDAQIQVQTGIKFATNFNWLIINQSDLTSLVNQTQVYNEIVQLKTLLATKKAIPTKYYLPKAAPGGDSTILKVTDLKMDAYMPNPSIDNMAKRPIIIYLHTGNFLPPGINGSPCGDKGDSSVVEICKGFARRGFIAIAIDYRLGWNPIATTEQERRGTLLNAVYRSIHDTKECVRVIKALEAQGNPYKFDASKIALFGEGTGGYIASAYSTLDKYAEIELPKFINPLSGKSYIDTSKVGYLDGTKGALNLYFPSATDTKVQVTANIGGALADTSWLEAGDAPVISMHCVRDPFAPFNNGTVIVPTTNEDVVEVQGANIAVKRAQRLGNNAIFATIPNGDPYTIKARSLYNKTVDYLYPAPDDKITINNGEGMYPVLLPKGPAILYNQASPWQWWDSTTAAATRVVAAPSTTAHMASKASNPDMSKSKSKRYQDTIHGYITPRIALAMGLLTANDLSVKSAKVTGVTIYPNPAQNTLTVRYKGAINAITITDLSGKVVFTTEVSGNSYTIPSLNLTKGMYIVNVATEAGLANEKLMIK